jgi:hypothetical protein
MNGTRSITIAQPALPAGEVAASEDVERGLDPHDEEEDDQRNDQDPHEHPATLTRDAARGCPGRRRASAPMLEEKVGNLSR